MVPSFANSLAFRALRTESVCVCARANNEGDKRVLLRNWLSEASANEMPACALDSITWLDLHHLRGIEVLPPQLTLLCTLQIPQQAPRWM